MKPRNPYHFRFDLWAMLLFLAVMSANIIWFCCPMDNDPFRIESVTPALDGIASVAQILMIGALVFLWRNNAPKKLPQAWKVITISCVVIYLGAWGCYYRGVTNFPLILLMTIMPCFAFAAFSIGRKNWLALCCCTLFFICHLISVWVNFG